MATPRRQTTEPIKRISLALPWSLYLEVVKSDPCSVNAEIIRLLKQALEAENNKQ